MFSVIMPKNNKGKNLYFLLSIQNIFRFQLFFVLLFCYYYFFVARSTAFTFNTIYKDTFLVLVISALVVFLVLGSFVVCWFFGIKKKAFLYVFLRKNSFLLFRKTFWCESCFLSSSSGEKVCKVIFASKVTGHSNFVS